MNCLSGTRWARKSSSQRRDEGRDLVAAPGQEQAEHLLHPEPLEELDPARAQARALDQELAAPVEDHVVLHLVAEHRRRSARRARAGSPPGARAERSPTRWSSSAAGSGRGRDEVDPVGVDLDHGGAQRPQPIEQGLHEAPALAGDPVGHVEVVPVALREGEVAVEGVDEDLEGLLERVQEDPVLGSGGLPGQPLGRDPELAQVAQQRGGDSQAVGGREQGLGQHQGRVERGHVHVEHVAGDPVLEHRGVAARDAAALAGGGDRPAAVEVLPHQQRVDLGRVAAQHRGLVVERQGLGLHEVGRRQDAEIARVSRTSSRA